MSNLPATTKAIGLANLDVIPLPLPCNLLEILPEDVKWLDVISSGKNPPGKDYGSRSELVFAVVVWMLKNDVVPGHVLSIITEPKFGISAHIIENSNPLRYGLRQIARALAFIETGSGLWPEQNDDGQPKSNSVRNVRYALARLGIDAQRNIFIEVDEIRGAGLDGRDLNDIGDILCSMFSHELRFNATPAVIKRELIAIAHDNTYHPVIEYLDSRTWDGKPRLETWLIDYCGADDTALNREFSAKFLIAGVRRIREPGVKFDTMLVLEGPQGVGKSRLAAKLAIKDEWFCGSLDLKSDDKTKSELLSRAWIVECQELDGLNKATSDSLKRFLSTPIDINRRAYARDAAEHRRHCIIIGTTNEGVYLRDLTGNRRIWPVHVNAINISRFSEDVDQLWAEASVRERAGEPITLSPDLWAAAASVQSQRMVDDAYADVLEGAFAERTGRVSMDTIKLVLDINTDKLTPSVMRRIKAIMAAIGWDYGSHRLHDMSGQDEKPRRGFANGTPDERKAEYMPERTGNGSFIVAVFNKKDIRNVPF
jgi:predicted P-loop ATPase